MINTIVTIIVTHQGVEKLTNGDEPKNPKDVGLLGYMSYMMPFYPI